MTNDIVHKSRESKIELLRIFSMLLIISLHWGGYCINILTLKLYSFEWFFCWFIRGIAYISVNVYVLITAYFLCKSPFRIRKLIKLVVEVWFYSVFIQWDYIYLLYEHCKSMFTNTYW